MYMRVKDIRESEYKFVDLVNEQFENFYRKMKLTYAYWRRYSYELTAYNTRIEKAGTKGKRPPRGSWAAMESVYKTYRESKLNEDELRQMAASFDSEISQTVTELEGNMITLSGSLRSQYEEWRQLLRKIYAVERGVKSEAPARCKIDASCK